MINNSSSPAAINRSFTRRAILAANVCATITFILAVTLLTVRAQTPLALAQGTGEISPPAYYELSGEARRLFGQKDYAKAADAFRKLTNAYPYNGDDWHLLGRALYETGQFKQAAESFQTAYQFGTLVQGSGQINTAGYAALAFAKADAPESALEWLERAILDHHYSGVETSLGLLQNQAFANLRRNARFQKLLAPTVGGDVSREEGWKIDLDHLLAQFRRINPQYSRLEIKEKIELAAARLREQLPRLADVQIAVEMQKITAMLTTSHTEVFLHRQPRAFKFSEPLPVNLWVFPEGVYVVDDADEHKSLIGSRIVTVDDTPVEKVVEKLRPLVPAEGEPTRLIMTRFLILPHVLQAVGAARESNRVTLGVVDRQNKTRQIEIASKPNHKWTDSLPLSPFAAAAAAPPLYMSRPNERYWFEHLPEDKAVYVRLTMMRDKPDGETIAALGLRLREFLGRHPQTKNLIVDLRGNTGGNSTLYPELLRTIVAFDAKQGNRVYAVTDRAVFSAATNFTVDLDRLTNAIFVGEPGGGQPRFNSDAMYFTLPYSGVFVILSNVVWNLSGPYDTRRWIAPDIPVALTAKDYFANRDTVMETLLPVMRKK